MNPLNEAVERTIRRRAAEHGELSERATRELERSIREDPDAFITAAPERALLVLDRALAVVERDRRNDDYRDDDAFGEALVQRMAALNGACDEALAIDPTCLDAAVLKIVSTDQPIEDAQRALAEVLATRPAPTAGEGADLADNLFLRPWLRAIATLCRWSFVATYHRRAVELGERSLELSPSDPYGVHLTLALAHARLEDEDALEALDKRFHRDGSAWMALARTLLLFKLNRLGPARRALAGYVRLFDGGAFALAHPAYVDPYLPDRPSYAPRTFEEALLATHEAEPLVVDTPDFVGWCHEQPGFDEAASFFAQRMGFDDR